MIIYKENNIIKKITPSKGYTEKSLLHLVPKGCEYKIVDETKIERIDEIPNFDAALTWDLTHDIEKLKELKKEEVLLKVKPELEKLDIKMLRNLSDTEMLISLEKEKQTLRDKISIVDDCKTIDEIKSIEV